MYKLFRMNHSSIMSSLRPVVVSGPSGTGKSTILKKLFKEYPDCFGFCVSHTTRKKRNGEIEGKQYHFTTEEIMKQKIKEGKFVEHAQFSGNLYGTSKLAIKTVLDMKRICILDIDEQGVKNIKNSDLEAIYIFIKPPSLEELERRLTSRGTETEESIKRRMGTAKTAMEYSNKPGSYDFTIVNNNLEEAYGNLKEFMKQTFPNHMKKINKYDPADELPLVANIKQIGNGQLPEKVGLKEDSKLVNSAFSEVELQDSVAEIPLSPTKTAAEFENPAVVNVGETPLLLINNLPQGNAHSTNSSVMVELEEPDADNAAQSNAVCGKQSWCSIF